MSPWGQSAAGQGGFAGHATSASGTAGYAGIGPGGMASTPMLAAVDRVRKQRDERRAERASMNPQNNALPNQGFFKTAGSSASGMGLPSGSNPYLKHQQSQGSPNALSGFSEMLGGFKRSTSLRQVVKDFRSGKDEMDPKSMETIRRGAGMGCASVCLTTAVVVLLALTLVAQGHISLDDHLAVVLAKLHKAPQNAEVVAIPLTGPRLGDATLTPHVPIPDNDASAPEASDALESTGDQKQEKEEVPEKEPVDAASDDSNKLSGDVEDDNAAKAVAPESAVAEPANEETSSQETTSRASMSEAAGGVGDPMEAAVSKATSHVALMAPRQCVLGGKAGHLNKALTGNVLPKFSPEETLLYLLVGKEDLSANDIACQFSTKECLHDAAADTPVLKERQNDSMNAAITENLKILRNYLHVWLPGEESFLQKHVFSLPGLDPTSLSRLDWASLTAGTAQAETDNANSELTDDIKTIQELAEMPYRSTIVALHAAASLRKPELAAKLTAKASRLQELMRKVFDSYKGADVDSLAQSLSSNVTTQDPPLDASTSTFVSGKGWQRTPAISNTSSDTADILRLNEEIDSEAKAALPESFDGFDELSFVIGEQAQRKDQRARQLNDTSSHHKVKLPSIEHAAPGFLGRCAYLPYDAQHIQSGPKQYASLITAHDHLVMCQGRQERGKKGATPPSCTFHNLDQEHLTSQMEYDTAAHKPERALSTATLELDPSSFELAKVDASLLHSILSIDHKLAKAFEDEQPDSQWGYVGVPSEEFVPFMGVLRSQWCTRLHVFGQPSLSNTDIRHVASPPPLKESKQPTKNDEANSKDAEATSTAAPDPEKGKNGKSKGKGKKAGNAPAADESGASDKQTANAQSQNESVQPGPASEAPANAPDFPGSNSEDKAAHPSSPDDDKPVVILPEALLGAASRRLLKEPRTAHPKGEDHKRSSQSSSRESSRPRSQKRQVSMDISGVVGSSSKSKKKEGKPKEKKGGDASAAKQAVDPRVKAAQLQQELYMLLLVQHVGKICIYDEA
mmetsp:Transcript_37495/g.71834  ORF Transcript_37495/g.71834 Transcript_37495/m.71834 type:complete len:1026 (+) Transcript_37495:71-3148(+)